MSDIASDGVLRKDLAASRADSMIRRLSMLTVAALGLSTFGCGGSSAQEPVGAGPAPAPAPAPAPVTSQDFATRCAQAGVIKCVGFDTTADFSTGSGGANGAYGYNSGIMPPWGTSDYTRATMDASVKASGAGALKFTIPSNSPADSSGTWFTNFSKDLSVQFGGDSEFYVQWRQRFSPEFLTTAYQGGGGFKQIIIGTGDVSGYTYSSCSTLEVPMFNYQQKGFPVMYNSCGLFDGFYQPFGASDFKLQNGRGAPYCLYSQGATGYFSPNGNCFGYKPNEWMTFQVRIKTGPRVGNVFQGSYVTMWMAREGQPSELVIDWGPYNLQAGAAADNERFGKVWLLPYNTGKSASQAHPTAYTWYDELIISRTKIADPN